MARVRYVSLPTRSVRNKFNLKLGSIKSNLAASDFISDIIDTFLRVLVRPDFLFSFIMCSAIVMTHLDDFSNGPLGSYLQQSKLPIAKHIIKNAHKFVAFLVVLPTIIGAPHNLRFGFSIVSLSAIYMFKNLPLTHYIIMSVLGTLFMKCRLPFTRVVVIVVACSFFWYDSVNVIDARTASIFSAPIVNKKP